MKIYENMKFEREKNGGEKREKGREKRRRGKYFIDTMIFKLLFFKKLDDWLVGTTFISPLFPLSSTKRALFIHIAPLQMPRFGRVSCKTCKNRVSFGSKTLQGGYLCSKFSLLRFPNDKVVIKIKLMKIDANIDGEKNYLK